MNFRNSLAHRAIDAQSSIIAMYAIDSLLSSKLYGEKQVNRFDHMFSHDLYTFYGKTLNKVDVQRDVGVHFHSSLKVAIQVERMVKKAYEMLAFIGIGYQGH